MLYMGALTVREQVLSYGLIPFKGERRQNEKIRVTFPEIVLIHLKLNP